MFIYNLIIMIPAAVISIIVLSALAAYLSYRCIELAYRLGDREREHINSGVPMQLREAERMISMLKNDIQEIVNGNEAIKSYHKNQIEATKKNNIERLKRFMK